MRHVRKVSSLLLSLLFVLSFSQSAHAQYFGRNKVQWEDFDFKVLRTEHFDIYYYEDEAEAVEDIGRMAERWYGRLSGVFEHEFRRKPIVLYANSADFQQTTTTSGLIGEGTGGFTDAFQNRVVLPLTGSYADNDHVLGHEIVHVFQYDIAASLSRERRRFNLNALPLWIVEGMAEYFSKGRYDPLTAMWIRDATDNDRLPGLRKLTRDPRYFPYRYGQALMAYIGGRYGDSAVINYFLAAGSYGLEDASPRVLGISSDQLFEDWHAASRELYETTFLRRPQTLGAPLLGRQKTRADLNIAPVLSPDGKWIAFLSTRELFSIDLFLADARTGEVVDRLVSSGTNPHYDALRFIDSAGGWSPDSRKLAIITFDRGDNRLTIVDVESRRIDRTIKVPGIDAMSNPAWSPDGRTIAMSVQINGSSDLFLFDVESQQVRRLTTDQSADLQPTWSPDGRTLAFVSDRGAGTDLTVLKYNDMRVATIDITSGAVVVLPLFATGKHINPQFAPDGRSLYFIANPQGISDIYRYTFEGGTIAQITNVATGVAGITALSPAMTVSARTGQIAFSLFENDDYNIYTLPASTEGRLVASRENEPQARAALLPPARTSRGTTTYLERPQENLPAPETRFERAPYKADLHLTYLGPPTFGIGADRLGYGVGGSITAFFSDILGEHTVGFTIQGGGTSTGNFATLLGGEVQYLNQENRINWGGAAAHIPYISVSARAFRDTVTVDGRSVSAIVYQERRDTTLLDEVSAIARYPLSKTRRFETNFGYQRLGFDSEILEEVYVDGQLVGRDTTGNASPEDLNFLRGSVAFVGDSSSFGFISPVRGTRYRYEAETLNGDLNFTTALADWRRYFFARPVTFAFRALHYGRYGDDAEDDRLRELYLGSASLVRGYEADTFSAAECTDTSADGSCPQFDRLLGSKIGLISAEVRIPLFGTEDFGLINASFLPTELVGFAEGGVAWTEAQSPELKYETDTTERVPVFSVGIAARILLSYIPIELYYAKPLQRPEEGFVFGFNIRPGW